MIKNLCFAAALLVVLAQCQNTQENIPPFLRRATQAQIQAFQGLIQNHGHLTEAALEAKVQQWAAQQGSPVAGDFGEFENFIKGAKTHAQAAHQQAVGKFSAAAKKADADLTAIAAQQHLPVREKGLKIQAYLNTLPQSVVAELQAAHQGAQQGEK